MKLHKIFLTRADAARVIGKTERWINQLVADGWLRAPVERGVYQMSAVVKAQINFVRDGQRRAAQSGGGLAQVQRARAAEIRRRLARDDKNIIEVDELVAVTSENIEDLRGRLVGVGRVVTADTDLAKKIDARISAAIKRATDRLAVLVAQLRAGGAAVEDADEEPEE